MDMRRNSLCSGTRQKDPDELAAIDRVADNLQQILEVGNKLPAASEPDKKKKKP